MNEFVKDGVNGRLVNVKEFRGRPDGYYWPLSIIDEYSLMECMGTYIANPSNLLVHRAGAFEYAHRNLDWRKNSRELNAWICNQTIRSFANDAQLRAMIPKIRKYDSLKNPLPWEWTGRGMVRILKQLYRRVRNFL